MGITHLSGLAVSGTTTLSGTVTATATGKLTTLTRATVSGTATLSGKVIGNASFGGVRLIATGGSSVISTAYVTQTGPILVTPVTGAVTRVLPVISARTSGTSFKVKLVTPSGTAATGSVSWLVVSRP